MRSNTSLWIPCLPLEKSFSYYHLVVNKYWGQKPGSSVFPSPIEHYPDTSPSEMGTVQILYRFRLVPHSLDQIPMALYAPVLVCSYQNPGLFSSSSSPLLILLLINPNVNPEHSLSTLQLPSLILWDITREVSQPHWFRKQILGYPCPCNLAYPRALGFHMLVRGPIWHSHGAGYSLISLYWLISIPVHIWPGSEKYLLNKLNDVHVHMGSAPKEMY